MKCKIEKSSGNVFQDLGVADPVNTLAKAALALEIDKTILSRELDDAKAAELMNIKISDIQHMRKGILSDFSITDLAKYLNLLTVRLKGK